MIELKYPSDVNDMLVSLYHSIVKFDLELTPVNAYVADLRSTGITNTEKFYKKFIDEIDYIKELATIQPTKTIKVKTLFKIQSDNSWYIASENTEIIKSFSETNLNQRISWFNHKPTDFAKTEIEVVESTNLEYLTK